LNIKPIWIKISIASMRISIWVLESKDTPQSTERKIFDPLSSVGSCCVSFYSNEITKMTIKCSLLMLAMLGEYVFAFNPSGAQIPFRLLSKTLSPAREVALHASRRSFVESFSIAVAGASIAVVGSENASASGGATAGGVYLLSAKQRYNGRVTKGVKGFLTLGGSLESGNIDDVKTFFKSEEDGMWKDFSAAAYLLANAFRRNSAAAPDTLPSVKVRFT
jgi:hypothetical protein